MSTSKVILFYLGAERVIASGYKDFEAARASAKDLNTRAAQLGTEAAGGKYFAIEPIDARHRRAEGITPGGRPRVFHEVKCCDSWVTCSGAFNRCLGCGAEYSGSGSRLEPVFTGDRGE